MSEKDSAHSVVIKIPRPRTVKKLYSDVKKKRLRNKTKTVTKPYKTTPQIYSLSCNKPLQMNVLKRDDLLLSYRLYAKEQESIKHKHRIGIKVHEKYKVINTNLRNRLHVEDPPDDVYPFTNVNDGYCQQLNDYTSTQYIPFYKSLRYQFHERLKIRQQIGYKRDCILNIEQNCRKEIQKYELSVQKYMDQVKQFDEFIANDYRKSMMSLKNCETLKAELNAKVLLKENLANKQFTIQSRLIGLDYMYFMQQKYGRFLYYLSPPSWRAKHREFAQSGEIEAKGFDLGSSSEEDTFNVIFKNMQIECYRGLVKPFLYFSCPDDLMIMFENIEKQLLHNFIHVTPLALHVIKLRKGVIELKSSIEQDTALVANLIKGFVQHVDFCEEKEAQLQIKFMKILYGSFYDTVASTDVLKLQMHLEFCYEKLYVEKSINMRLILTAKALEKMYMEYLFKLDSFTNDKVKLAMNQCIEKGKKNMKKAEKASRELRLFNRLEHSLLRAYEKRNTNVVASPLLKVKVPLFRKSKRSSKHAVTGSSHRSLTEAEIEYLCLFTDWTEAEDPVKYLQSLRITDRKDSVYK